MNELCDISYIKATDLNRGKASSCIKKVHDSNCDIMVLKNSEPYAVIISVEKYNKYIRINHESTIKVEVIDNNMKNENK